MPNPIRIFTLASCTYRGAVVDDGGAQAVVLAELTALRAEAVARIKDLGDDVEEIVSASRDTNADDEHDPDGSTIAFERSMSLSLLASARSRLAEVDQAIERVHAGTYGFCTVCGEPIGAERLLGRPAVATCVRCAAAS